MFRAIDIAKYIISYCNGKKKPISNLKLQKMLYYAWVDFFKKTGKELYFDEICAWQFGPVVPNVYYAFCSYAGMPISQNYATTLEETDKCVLDPILEKYIDTAASTLVDRTHQYGTPWALIFKDGEGIRNAIPFSLIKEKG